jgi:hypothetical protein
MMEMPETGLGKAEILRCHGVVASLFRLDSTQDTVVVMVVVVEPITRSSFAGPFTSNVVVVRAPCSLRVLGTQYGHTYLRIFDSTLRRIIIWHAPRSDSSDQTNGHPPDRCMKTKTRGWWMTIRPCKADAGDGSLCSLEAGPPVTSTLPSAQERPNRISTARFPHSIPAAAYVPVLLVVRIILRRPGRDVTRREAWNMDTHTHTLTHNSGFCPTKVSNVWKKLFENPWSFRRSAFSVHSQTGCGAGGRPGTQRISTKDKYMLVSGTQHSVLDTRSEPAGCYSK